MNIFGKLAAGMGMGGKAGSPVRSVSPQEALETVKAGNAVLVDVREQDEWEETGVAEPAVLLPLGEIGSDAGRELAEKNAGKEFIFYCRSGGRSGAAAKAFASQGLRAANAGGFSDWAAAGLPVRKV